MKPITLQFSELEKLVAFQKALIDHSYEINYKQLTIYLVCDNNTASEALAYYEARVVDKQHA